MENRVLYLDQKGVEWLWHQIAELFHLSEDGLSVVAYTGDWNDLVVKPVIPDKMSQLTNDKSYVIDAHYTHTDNNFTDSLKYAVEHPFSGDYMDLTNKPDLSQFATLEQTEDMIDGAIGSVYTFRGTASAVGDLPAEGNTYGDVYAVGQTSYAWNGTQWVELYAALDLSTYMKLTDMEAITSTEIAALFA